MIKLNNKNITYVALADSNNSLKAPKEIWYADSNNSVKLVYQRKDALIEGEDYEKYHWLVGHLNDGVSPSGDSKGAYFRLNRSIDLTNKVMKLKLGTPCRDFVITGKTVSAGGYNLRVYIMGDGSQTLREAIGATTINSISQSTKDDEVIFDFVNNVVSAGNISIPIQGTEYTFIRFHDVYRSVTKKIGNITIDNELNLIPCKLLKPVPKWLDANGIRRQVGECGMIDLISGKFYGNVNSVGTFTVENYYERKEWLVGDGSAYIDTNKTLVETDIITTKFVLIDNPSNYYLIYGNSSGNFVTTACIQFRGRLGMSPIATDNRFTVNYQLNSEITISHSATEILANGTSVWQGTSVFETTDRTCCLFATGSDKNHCFNGKIGYFNISDNLHLIPCTLTMDLPASMDANNIPRTKGTSGMWDLVSDRFYGNVASSGTFKAVNLAEGVDYEVHDWLVAEIPIGVTLMTLPINSDTLYYERIWKTFGNSMYFETDGYSYFTSWTKKIDIYDRGNNETIYASSSLINVDDVIEVNSSGNATLINNIELQQYGFPILDIRFHNAHNATATVISLTSSITVDGIERYIPVKLLRSIPSKYDANGIARQAGECGMYDTINDKFYGNVASSGSFSVSDDN